MNDRILLAKAQLRTDVRECKDASTLVRVLVSLDHPLDPDTLTRLRAIVVLAEEKGYSRGYQEGLIEGERDAYNEDTEL